jgi:EAL domain-containing protein (putative c-di-GMP-specific phosphodiesterase class I)
MLRRHGVCAVIADDGVQGVGMSGRVIEMGACAGRLERIVEFAHRHLQVDVVYLSEFIGGRQLYRAVAGDGDSFDIAVGRGVPVAASYAQRMVAGEIPNVIGDTGVDERVADLPVTRVNGVGAYVGVPIRRPDGELLGALSGVSHEPNRALDQRAVRLLSLLSELIVYDVDEQSRVQELHARILRFFEPDGFGFAYQPMFDLTSGDCVGVEALARFPEPFHQPDHAFTTAEEVGLGLELERAGIRQAVEILPQLAAGQFLAVNVSPRALLDVGQQVDLRRESPLSRLVVEVTERSAIEAYAALRDELAPLRERGLRIAVDDVGAGYASLRHILELRPDFIKLDRWLIDGLAGDRGRRVAVTAFVSLARELGARVVAEGVERPEDLAAVRELGLDAAQGYLLGGPSTDPSDLSRWCAAWAPGPRACGVAAHPDPISSPPGRGGHAEPVPGAVADLGGSSRVTRGGALERELGRLELDRRVSQRLEAVGQLAAGIAHEINTPLQFVGDSIAFLKDAVDELLALTGLYRETLHSDAAIPVERRRQTMREAEARADVEYLCERIPAAFDRTVDGIARVRSIVQAMKRFSHASGSEAAPADLNEALETTLAVCRNEYKYVAEVELDLGPLPAVVCNIGELNQVFLNLIINAAQAIEEQLDASGQLGQIRIATRVEADMAVIEIADDGPGIPPALQDRIYEPFFTTKEIGKGTGQGLALALATIQRHSGTLHCVSSPGDGTTFTIRLPLQTAPLHSPVAG